MARTPEGLALTEARVAAGPRVTPEQAGHVIQPELKRIYDRREGMRAALADPEYTAAREAPETVGIERSIEVERPGEPIVTQPAFLTSAVRGWCASSHESIRATQRVRERPERRQPRPLQDAARARTAGD